MVNTTWFFIVLLNFSIESGETCRKSWETAAFKKEIIINKRYVIKLMERPKCEDLFFYYCYLNVSSYFLHLFLILPIFEIIDKQKFNEISETHVLVGSGLPWERFKYDGGWNPGE